MNAIRLTTDSVRTLGRHRLRTAFILLASVVGVAALTFVLSVGRGAQQKMLRTVHQVFGDSGILIGAGPHRMMGGPRADAARLTLDDIEAVARALPQVAVWDPQVSVNASVRHGTNPTTARIVGVSERYARVWNRTASRGRFFDAAEVRRTDRVALIGETVARALFGNKDPLQGEILVNAVPFTVIGVLERFGTDLHGMDRDNEVVVPISTLMRRVANVDTIAAAKLILADSTQTDAVARQARALLRARHGLTAGQPDDFNIITPVLVQQMVGKMRRVLTLYLPLASLVVIAVGGMVSAALLFGSVNSRVAEIGVRRAVGAQPADIATLFLVEAIVTMFGGGVVGFVVGFGAAELLSLHVQLGPMFSWSTFAIALLVSTLTGFIAGVLPARRAGQLLPSEALR